MLTLKLVLVTFTKTLIIGLRIYVANIMKKSQITAKFFENLLFVHTFFLIFAQNVKLKVQKNDLDEQVVR